MAIHGLGATLFGRPYPAISCHGPSGSEHLRLLWINTIDMIGVHGPKADAIQLVSNSIRQWRSTFRLSCRKPTATGPATRSSCRCGLSKKGFPMRIQSLAKSLPNRPMPGPRKQIGSSWRICQKNLSWTPISSLEPVKEREQIVLKIQAEKGQAAIDRLNSLVDLLEPFVTYGPSFIRATLNEAKGLRH